MARPAKLTDETQARICAALEAGNFFATACELAGVSASAGYQWLARGEGRCPGRPSTPAFVAFVAAVKSARAKAEAQALSQVRAAADRGTWQAAAWFLERSAPHRWGRGSRDEVTVEDLHTVANAAMRLLPKDAQSDYIGVIKTLAEVA